MPPTPPARLDADGTAEPLTRIVHHPREGACQGPQSTLVNPELVQADGTRVPLVGETASAPRKSTLPEWAEALRREKREEKERTRAEIDALRKELKKVQAQRDNLLAAFFQCSISVGEAIK